LGEGTQNVYQNAMTEIHRELRRPGLQRSVFSFVQNSPSEVVRAKLSRSEIQHRAVAFISDDLLENVPEDNNSYSLFQGFQATLPESEESEHRKKHRRHSSRGQKLLEENREHEGPPNLVKVKKERDRVSHRLEMMGIRKNMCSSEIIEIDKKIANLTQMRKIVLDRLADLEDDELKVEQELAELDNKVEDLQDLLEEEQKIAKIATPPGESEAGTEDQGVATPTASTSPSFMSQSIYEKLPSPKAKRGRPLRRRSMPIRHEHFEPGTELQTIPAHNDMITALDFDAPFGTMVTAALDDTVRVWDLNQGRCLGLLEGHRASVRCLQVEDNICATGSIDASVRLWDLSRAEYPTTSSSFITKSSDEEEYLDPETPTESPTLPVAATSNMANTHLFSLESHVSEITALHFHKDTLVSGSADKTLRQWDLVKGRCVQTLDVLWAAAQASASLNPGENNSWRTTSRLPDKAADFVGALQCFDAALACGTADGLVRLWDLRTGQVSRSLVGHTGPVTCLQFDDVHLVTGSVDRSIRVSTFFYLISTSFANLNRYGTFEQAPFLMHMPMMPQLQA
jgi:mitochondrial division protein 1